MAQRHHAQLFEVLISQIAQYREIDVVVGKALRVVRQAEALEPVCNLLHSTSRKLVSELEVSILSDKVQTRQSNQGLDRPQLRGHQARATRTAYSQSLTI